MTAIVPISQFLVSKKVNDTLIWLTENNPLCKEIIIDRSRLKELPVYGDVNLSVRFIYDSQCIDCDRGPVEENEEEVETSSFMSEKTQSAN